MLTVIEGGRGKETLFGIVYGAFEKGIVSEDFGTYLTTPIPKRKKKVGKL